MSLSVKRINREYSTSRHSYEWNIDVENNEVNVKGLNLRLKCNNYPFSTPRMMFRVTPRDVVQVKGHLMTVCVSARRAANVEFLKTDCPCCASPLCNWFVGSRIDSIIDYALYLSDLRDFQTNSSQFQNCRLNSLPDDVLLHLKDQIWI